MTEVEPPVPESRRRNMAAIRGRHTKPEVMVRRMLHRLGYRFRLHARDLPGTPDIVFRRIRRAVEVRGCFWHRHPGCPGAAVPRTRAAFWAAKFGATLERDRRNMEIMAAKGWRVLVIWECEVDSPALAGRLHEFLHEPDGVCRGQSVH